MTSVGFFKELVGEVIDDRLTQVAAQLAYSSLLALFPFLIFVVTVLGLLPVEGAAGQLLVELSYVMPPTTHKLVSEAVYGVVRAQSLWLLIVSLAGSMWAASSGVAALTNALNTAYRAKETRSWVGVRLRALLVTLASTVLLVLAMPALLIGPHLAQRVSDFLGISSLVAAVWRWMRWPVTVVALSLLLAIFYWVCPNVRQPFRRVLPGAFAAVPAWIGATLLFNLYVSHLGSFNRTYGALGTGVVLLVWLYVSGLVVLLGGETNAILGRHRGRARRHDEERTAGACPLEARPVGQGSDPGHVPA